MINKMVLNGMLLDIGASRKKKILQAYTFNYIDPSKNDIEKIHAPIQIMITVQIQSYIYNDR